MLSRPLGSRELAMVSIDPSNLTFCTNPDGSRQELGKGAFGAVGWEQRARAGVLARANPKP